MFRRVVLALACLSSSAHATYSIVAVDTASRQVGGSGTSCIGNNSVRVIYGSVPGKGAVHAQALLGGPDRLGAAVMQMGMDVPPAMIIASITQTSFDANAQRRQYGVVDLMMRSAGFTGTQTGAYAGDVQRQYGTFTFSVQGNILTSMAVLTQSTGAFEAQGCDLADRLMLSLEAGALNGEGDSRCTPFGVPSDSAFIEVDREGEAAGAFLRLEVTGTRPNSPLPMLRAMYDAWRATHPCPAPSSPDAGTGGDGDAGLDPGDDPMGGCCSTTDDPSALALALLVGFALRRRRQPRRPCMHHQPGLDTDAPAD
jgi:MYXO-CTERM domain-containing protein